MRKIILDFVRRGLTACGIGPIVLAIMYMILEKQGVMESLTVDQVCTGIFSITALAFIAGGMNAIYQIEHIPLLMAVLLHGGVLYVGYLITYLLNNWLKDGMFSVLVFTGIFLVGYVIIWVIIYSIIKRRTNRVNEILKVKQQDTKGRSENLTS